jgi:hypothetical protein
MTTLISLIPKLPPPVIPPLAKDVTHEIAEIVKTIDGLLPKIDRFVEKVAEIKKKVEDSGIDFRKLRELFEKYRRGEITLVELFARIVLLLIGVDPKVVQQLISRLEEAFTEVMDGIQDFTRLFILIVGLVSKLRG